MTIKPKELLLMFLMCFAHAALATLVMLVAFSVVITLVKVAFAGPPFAHVEVWPRLLLLLKVSVTAGVVSATMSCAMCMIDMRKSNAKD